MKKLIAVLLSVILLLSLAACGSGGTEPEESGKTTSQSSEAEKSSSVVETEAESKPAPATEGLTIHENTFFTVAYSEEDGWTIDEEDVYTYDEGGSVYIAILDDEGYPEISVSIEANKDDPESFRESMDENGIDMKAYAAGEAETVDVGGQPMLYADAYDGRYFFGRNEAAGVTYTVDTSTWEDPRVEALVRGITCTASGTDNIEPPWPWDGEAFSGGTMSAAVGESTITAEFLPMSEPLTTFNTFDHEVEVIGDKVYLLSDTVLREYTLNGSALTFMREIPVDEEFALVERSGDALVLSGFMSPVVGHDGDTVLYSCDGPDKLTMAPDGTWGISWFSSGDSTERYTLSDGTLTGEAFPFNEVDTVSQINIDDTYIYVSGSSAEDDEQYVFVYDHSGTLQFTLAGEPDGSFGIGSITFVTKTGNGFLAMDGNMREVILWAADGTWLGSAEDSELFGTYYPWFATGDTMDDGSVIVVMTEDRADESAMEAIAFKVTVS